MPCAPRAASSRAPSSAGTLPASATSVAPAGTGTTPWRACATTSPSCATRPIPAESPPLPPHHHHPFPLLKNLSLRGLPFFPGCHPSRFSRCLFCSSNITFPVTVVCYHFPSGLEKKEPPPLPCFLSALFPCACRGA
uniref:Uncharacterized protein n=1 Tax=Ixodes scapularis TaxID=6945 RepID=A0A4D5RBU3_IXOSC